MFYCFLIGNNNKNSMYFNVLTVKVRPPPPYSFFYVRSQILLMKILCTCSLSCNTTLIIRCCSEQILCVITDTAGFGFLKNVSFIFSDVFGHQACNC